MEDELAKRRRDEMWSRLHHPGLSPDELVQFMIETSEGIMDKISSDDAWELSCELVELRADYEMSKTAADAFKRRLRSVCEMVQEVTPLPEGDLA